MTLQDSIYHYFGQENCRITREEPVLYRCIKKDNAGRPYQIVYVDESDAWLETRFPEYLDSILQDDFYELDGYLQWNFYYYFICPADIISEYSMQKVFVENNEVYARKFVLTEYDYIQMLADTQSIKWASSEDITGDLYTRWVNFLRDKKLYFVYNETDFPNYKGPIDDYINNGPSDDSEEVENFHIQPVGSEMLDKITTLNLITFRKYPLKRTFDLAQVNLLHGPNAAGKTSFFDALELIITGEAEGNSATDYNLELTDINGNQFSFPVNSSICKQRDMGWYKSAFTRGHNLNGNFNKFNYYASDAAFLLKQDDDRNKNDFQEIIAHIALGREVNRLEERIVGFKKRFEELLGQFRYEEERLNTELHIKNEQSQQITEEKRDAETYKEPLIKLLKELQWKYSSQNEPEKFIVNVDTSLALVRNALESIKTKTPEPTMASLEEVKKEVIRLENKMNELLRLRKSSVDKKLVGYEKEKEREFISSYLPIIKELQPYYSHEYFLSLTGLGGRMKAKISEIDRLKAIRKESESILGQPFLEKVEVQNTLIIVTEQELKDSLSVLATKQFTSKASIAELEKGISDLSAVIANIQSLGISYLSLNPDASSCPLCNTLFEKEHLMEAISKSRETFSSSKALQDLKLEDNEHARQLAEIERNLACISAAKKIAMTFDPKNWITMTINGLVAQINSNNKAIDQLTEDLAQLNILQARFANDKLSEDRLIVLEEKLGAEFNISIKTNENIINLRHEQEEKLRMEEGSLRELMQSISEDDKAIRQLFDSVTTDQEVLASRLAIFKELEHLFGLISLQMELPPSIDVFLISEKLGALASSFELYKKAYMDAKDQSKTLLYIEEESKSIIMNLKEVLRKKQNASEASEALTQLLNEQNKEQFLQDFFTANKNEIVDIFRLIHSPREFSDILFEENHVSLVAVDGNKRTVNEISTGQRSALALSLFLSLNKNLPNGPNMILMDDPVTYVDDVNMLSFLDYLRELTVQTGRQIFFATANADMAFLFHKKFEFLGDDNFKQLNLSRED